MTTSSIHRPSPSSRLACFLRRSVVLFIGAAALAACDSPTKTQPGAVWTADLAGTGSYSDLAGAAEVWVWSQTIRPRISISTAGSEKTYLWRVAGGTCGDPKSIVGTASDYRELRTDTAGVARDSVLIGATLVRDSLYHVRVHPKEQADSVAACAALTRQ